MFECAQQIKYSVPKYGDTYAAYNYKKHNIYIHAFVIMSVIYDTTHLLYNTGQHLGYFIALSRKLKTE